MGQLWNIPESEGGAPEEPAGTEAGPASPGRGPGAGTSGRLCSGQAGSPHVTGEKEDMAFLRNLDSFLIPYWAVRLPFHLFTQQEVMEQL